MTRSMTNSSSETFEVLRVQRTRLACRDLAYRGFRRKPAMLQVRRVL